MAKLVFGLNQSLDGYVDNMAFSPSLALFRHFIEAHSIGGAARSSASGMGVGATESDKASNTRAHMRVK